MPFSISEQKPGISGRQDGRPILSPIKTLVQAKSKHTKVRKNK